MYRYTILNTKLNKGYGTISVYSENKYSTDDWKLMIEKVVGSFSDEEWEEATFELVETRITELYNDFIVPEKGAIIDSLISRKDMKISDIEFEKELKSHELKGFNIVVK